MKLRIFTVVVFLIIVIIFGYVLFQSKENTGQPSADKVKTVIIQEEIREPEEELKELDEIIPVKDEIKLLFLGDIATLEPLGNRIKENKSYNPLSKVMQKFSEYDYVIGKHEATIDGESVGAPQHGKAYTFSVPKESVRIYKEAGIDAFSYANNHTKDYGPESVIHTINLLRQGGIDVFGAGKNQDEAFTPLIKEFNGMKIAFLAFNSAEYAHNIATLDSPGTACFCEVKVRESIAFAKTQVDIVIVVSEAGTEHVSEPNELQIQWANIYTSAGADLVVGGHPHVRQRMEEFNGKKVIHSIGNFMFPGQAWNPEAQIGWAAEVIIKDKQIKTVNLLESEMDFEGVPSWR